MVQEGKHYDCCGIIIEMVSFSLLYTANEFPRIKYLKVMGIVSVCNN